MRLPSLAAAIALVAGAACTTSSGRPNPGSPLVGDWGGVHAALSLTPTGGTITYDCGNGVVSGPLVPDDAGNFDVRGVHMRGHGGPVRIGEVPDSVPARYVGRVDDRRMSLRVAVGADTLGPFQLQLAAAPQLFRCL